MPLHYKRETKAHKNKSMVCFGEILLRHSTIDDYSLSQSTSLDLHVGGAEFNVAINLRSLDVSSKMVSALPGNLLGDIAINKLKLYSVNHQYVIRNEHRMAQYFYQLRGNYFQPKIIYDRRDSAFTNVTDNQFDWHSILKNSDLFHFSGINLAIGEQVASESLIAAKMAVNHNLLVSFDANYRPLLWKGREGEAKILIEQSLQLATLVFLTEQDIALILRLNDSSHSPPKRDYRQYAYKKVFENYPNIKWIASTFKEYADDGSLKYTGLLSDRSQHSYSSTYKIVQIVDKIGTGDAFASGIIYGLLNNYSMQDTAEFATALATAKYSLKGDVAALNIDEVNSIISKQWLTIKR